MSEVLNKAKYFSIQELVPEKVFKERREKAWFLLDDRIPIIADILRENYGPTFINTWALSDSVRSTYGTRTESGLRTVECNNYKPYSQHSFGRAVDCVFRDVHPDNIRKDIESGEITFPYNVIIEKLHGRTMGWLHIAVGNYGKPVTIVYG